MHHRAVRACALAVVATLVTALSASACQSGKGRADWRSTPFGRDMDRICNAVEQSGASQQPDSRAFLIAQWLGRNLESQEGRHFLAKIQPLEGAAKADALDDQARQVGLGGCPLALEWRQPRP